MYWNNGMREILYFLQRDSRRSIRRAVANPQHMRSTANLMSIKPKGRNDAPLTQLGLLVCILLYTRLWTPASNILIRPTWKCSRRV